MRRVVLLVALVVLTGVTACTTPEAGSPNPSPSGGEPTPTSPGTSLPPRPHDLPIDGVDPCSLLTAQQRSAFAIDQEPRAGKQPGGPLKDSPTCNFDTSVGSANDWGFMIIASTTIGLAEFLDQIQQNRTRRMITVSGFPASQDEQKSQIGPGNDTCFVDVDVADGQMLAFQFGQIAADQDKALPMETLCAKAVEVAEAALTTLQGQR